MSPAVAHRLARTALIAALVALSVSLLANIGTYVESRRNITHLCQITRTNRNYIRGAIQRAQHAIPTISYYQTHPVEAQRQLAELRRELHELPREVC